MSFLSSSGTNSLLDLKSYSFIQALAYHVGTKENIMVLDKSNNYHKSIRLHSLSLCINLFAPLPALSFSAQSEF